jgi:hypothetical protein
MKVFWDSLTYKRDSFEACPVSRPWMLEQYVPVERPRSKMQGLGPK